jgi:hypothetical protein
MAVKQQWSIRGLFILTIFVAHALAKPYFAQRLVNASDVRIESTWIPCIIQIEHVDDTQDTPAGAWESRSHHDTYLGALGQYWLMNRQTDVTSIFPCGNAVAAEMFSEASPDTASNEATVD